MDDFSIFPENPKLEESPQSDYFILFLVIFFPLFFTVTVLLLFHSPHPHSDQTNRQLLLWLQQFLSPPPLTPTPTTTTTAISLISNPAMHHISIPYHQSPNTLFPFNSNPAVTASHCLYFPPPIPLLQPRQFSKTH